MCIDAKYLRNGEGVETSLENVAKLASKCYPAVALELLHNKRWEIYRAQSINADTATIKVSNTAENFNERKTVGIKEIVRFLSRDYAKNWPNLKELISQFSYGLFTLFKDEFDGVRFLKKIEISFSDMVTIEDGAFDTVPLLENLDLKYNELQSLPSNVFKNLPLLKSLNLNGNKITALTSDIISEQNVIEVFMIYRNKLEKVDSNIIEQLGHATEINFAKNTCIDQAYSEGNKTLSSREELTSTIIEKCNWCAKNVISSIFV